MYIKHQMTCVCPIKNPKSGVCPENATLFQLYIVENDTKTINPYFSGYPFAYDQSGCNVEISDGKKTLGTLNIHDTSIDIDLYVEASIIIHINDIIVNNTVTAYFIQNQVNVKQYQLIVDNTGKNAKSGFINLQPGTYNFLIVSSPNFYYIDFKNPLKSYVEIFF